MSGQVGTVALALGISVIASRVLGPAGNGVCVLVGGVPVMAAAILEMGMGASATVMIRRGEIPAPSAASLLLGYSIVLAAIVAVAGYLIGENVLAGALPGLSETARITIVLGTAATVACGVGRSALIAIGDVWCAAVLWTLDRAVTFMGVVGLLALGRLSVDNLARSYAAGYCVAALVTWVVVGSRVGLGSLPSLTAALHTLGFGFRIGLGNGLMALNYRLDSILVNGMLSTAAAGIYGAAASLVSILWYTPNMVGLVWLPRVADLDPLDGASRTRRVLKWTVATSVILGAVLALSGGPAMRLLFGPAFSAGIPALWILIPGAVVLAVPKVLNSHLLAHGVTRVATSSAAIGLVLTITLDVLLIPRMGIVGAAIASTISYSVYGLFFAFAYAKAKGRLSDRAVDVGGVENV